MTLSIFIFLLVLSSHASIVNEPVVVSLTAVAKQAEISVKGETIMTCERGGSGIQIYRNNKVGFEVDYTFPNSSTCYDATMIGEGDMVVFNIFP